MAKVAIPKIVRGPDGNLVISYVDAESMATIPSSLLGEYEIYNAHDQALKEMGAKVTPVEEKKPEEEKESVAKEVTKGAGKPSGGDTRDNFSYGRGNMSAESLAGKSYTAPEREEMSGSRDKFGQTKAGGMLKGAAGAIGGRMVGGAIGGMVGGPIGAGLGGLAGAAIGSKLAKGPKEQYDFPDKPDAPDTRRMAEQTVNDLLSDDPEVSAKAAQGVIGRTAENPLGIGSPTANTPGYNPDDSLGRQHISKVDFDKIGLHPDMAAKAKGFQRDALAANLDLSVDVANTRRTAEQQQALAAKGVSKTNIGYHNTGFAVDISPTAVDPTGNITDQETLAASRALAEKHGFGLLNPSWDPAHMQAQVPGATARSLYGMPRDAFGNVQLAPEQSLSVRGNEVPTPTERPEYDPNKSVARNVIDQAKDVSLDKLSGVDMTQKSPAALSNLGFGPKRSPEEMERMGLTIAGELSPAQLAALANDDPVAKQEFANVMSTMENRAQSKTVGNLQDALNEQYNSLMPDKMATTTSNFGKFRDTIMANVGDFYTGGITPTTPDATHYYNPDIANPGWGMSLKDASKVGSHKFGSLVGEYLPGDPHTQALSRYAGAQINNQVGKGFASPDYDFASRGPSYGSLLSSPSESGKSRFGGAGLGYSAGGGNDSPSEGGSRFGGGGLGSSGKSDYSGKGGYDSPSEGGGKFGGGGLGSGIGKGSGGSGYGNSGTGSGGLGGGMGGSVSGEGSKSSGSKSGGGLGKNSDGSDNGWGGRSGSV